MIANIKGLVESQHHAHKDHVCENGWQNDAFVLSLKARHAAVHCNPSPGYVWRSSSQNNNKRYFLVSWMKKKLRPTPHYHCLLLGSYSVLFELLFFALLLLSRQELAVTFALPDKAFEKQREQWYIEQTRKSKWGFGRWEFEISLWIKRVNTMEKLSSSQVLQAFPETKQEEEGDWRSSHVTCHVW